MKALTICQPFANLIMRGDKRIENRTWKTNYRGRLYIHAGVSKKWLATSIHDATTEDYTGPFGVVLGHVQLIDCVDIADRKKLPTWALTHRHAFGPWLWILEKPVAFRRPVPAKGSLSIWAFTR